LHIINIILVRLAAISRAALLLTGDPLLYVYKQPRAIYSPGAPQHVLVTTWYSQLGNRVLGLVIACQKEDSAVREEAKVPVRIVLTLLINHYDKNK